MGSRTDEGVGPTKTAELQPRRTRPGGRLRTKGSALHVTDRIFAAREDLDSL
jgi:hypothetical protein